MEQYLKILDVKGREILDSRGNPTVEAEITVRPLCPKGNCITARASVPSGASTGMFEAVELRDKQARYGGLGVQEAVNNINEHIKKVIEGHNALDQQKIDGLMIKHDGTQNKGKLGANAILAVSLANAKVCAKALNIPLYKYLGGFHTHLLPVPMMNILNGGCHADNTVDFQEFMIMPVGFKDFSKGLRACAEIYHTLKKLLKERGLSTGVGDEGGFAPNLKNAEEVLDFLMEAIKNSGYMPEKEIKIAMDAAASELYDKESKKYVFPGEAAMVGHSVERTSEEMIDYYDKLIQKYPIFSIEDGLDEEDWAGWKKLTGKIGHKVQLVGDDLFVTNPERLAKGIREGVANSILIKVNQIGTLTESFRAIEMAMKAGYTTVISHRSGETSDTTIAHIAVAVNAGQIKTGAPCRSDRVEKYNELLRIEEQIRNKY